MKNISIALLSMVAFTACTRPAMDSAKLQIQFPAVSKSAALSGIKTASPAYTSQSGSYSSPASTGFSGTLPINCYVVMVGGPEASMSQNSCGLKAAGTNTIATPMFSFGSSWQGAVSAGGSVELDVPAGDNRSVYVVGFWAASGACNDLRQNGYPKDGQSSKPYLLGKATSLQFKSGTTVTVPVTLAFDSTQYFDTCAGPDMPPENYSGPGSNPSVVPTTFKISKNWFPYDSLVSQYMSPGVNFCQTVDVRLVDSQGSEGSLSTPLTITPTMHLTNNPAMYPILFKSMQDCQANVNSVSSLTIPANSNWAQVVFSVPYVSGGSTAPVDTFNITVASSNSTLTQASATFPIYSNSANTFDLEGPWQILPGVCYPYNITLKSITGVLTAGSFPVPITLASTGMSVYSNQADCSADTSALSNLNLNQSITPVYVKLPASGSISPGVFASLAISTSSPYVAMKRGVYQGFGDSTPAGLDVMGNNMMMLNSWDRKDVYLVNQYHTPVLAPAAIAVNLNLSASVVGCSSQPTGGPPVCSTPVSSVSIPPGSYVASAYMIYSALGNVAFSPTGMLGTTALATTNPLNVFVDGPAALAVVGPSSPVANGSCTQLTVNLLNASGSIAMNNYANFTLTSSPISPSTLNFYTDATCSSGAMSSYAGSTSSVGPATASTIFVKVNNSAGTIINPVISITGAPYTPGQFNLFVNP